MASAVQFEAKLKELIRAERAEQVEMLTAGGPEDHAAYRETVGYIRALDSVDRWCDETTKQLDER